MERPKTNCIDILKGGVLGDYGIEREELKHEKINEEFGLLEHSINLGRDAKTTGILYCVLISLRDFGVSRSIWSHNVESANDTSTLMLGV